MSIQKHESLTVKELNDKIKFETVVIEDLLEQYLPALVDDIEADKEEAIETITQEFEDKLESLNDFLDGLTDEIDDVANNGLIDTTSKTALMSIYTQLINRK